MSLITNFATRPSIDKQFIDDDLLTRNQYFEFIFHFIEFSFDRLFLRFQVIHVIFDLLSNLNIFMINRLSESLFGVFQKLDTIKFELLLDKIPILNKMSKHIYNTISSHLNGNILPWHSRLERLIQSALFIESWCIHILCPIVVELATVPKLGWVEHKMIGSIPTTIANIKATHKSNSLINNHHFLVMAPKQRNSSVWMSHYLNVPVKPFKNILHMFRVIIYKSFGLHENDNEDSNTSFCSSL